MGRGRVEVGSLRALDSEAQGVLDDSEDPRFVVRDEAREKRQACSVDGGPAQGDSGGAGSARDRLPVRRQVPDRA